MRQVKGAQVICATCIGAGADILSKRAAAVRFGGRGDAGDGGGDARPALPRAEQLVMLGDQCQLPPTVVSRHPTALAASSPLFNRLIADGAAPLLLDCQYRMHPAIAMLPCDLVYGGRLQTGVDGADRPAPPGFDWPRRDWPVALVPVLHGQESTEGVSKLNRTEAEATARVVDGLLRAGVKPSEIGVISPYGAQVRVLRSLLRSGARDPNSVEVSSVDGFQAREKEVIVFSCVRANAGGALGFLADARRLNVAFTRARCGLIVLGNPSTLGREEGTAWWHRRQVGACARAGVRRAAVGRVRARATRGASNAVMARAAASPTTRRRRRRRAACLGGRRAVVAGESLRRRLLRDDGRREWRGAVGGGAGRPAAAAAAAGATSAAAPPQRLARQPGAGAAVQRQPEPQPRAAAAREQQREPKREPRPTATARSRARTTRARRRTAARRRRCRCRRGGRPSRARMGPTTGTRRRTR